MTLPYQNGNEREVTGNSSKVEKMLLNPIVKNPNSEVYRT